MDMKVYKGLITVILLFTGLFLTVSGAQAEGQVDFSGSLEMSGITQHSNPDYLLGLLYPAVITPSGNGLKFRGDFKYLPSEQLTVKARLGFQDESLAESGLNSELTFDRAYFDYTPGAMFSLRAGKQRLAWGTGYAWNPTDILDQPRNAFTDVDNPAGVMALRGDLNFGPVTGQLFSTWDDDWNNTGKAVRLKTSPGGVDLTAGWVQPEAGDPAWIADFAYSVAGIGLHGEVLYLAEGNWQTGGGKVNNYLFGLDYNFPGGYYLALEYYHNDLAFSQVSDLVTYAMAHPDFGQDDLLGLVNNGGVLQNHYFLRFTKTIVNNLNSEIMLVYGPADQSLEAQPKLEYTWKDNLMIFAKYLLVKGDGQAEANLLPLSDRLDLGLKVIF